MSDRNPQFNYRPPQFRLPKGKSLYSIILVVLIMGILATGIYQVDQREESVILLLGKFNRITGPGLHLKMPFGIEKNYNVPTQVIQNMSFGFRTNEYGGSQTNDYPQESVMLTGDLNIVDVEWIIQYRITDPRAWLFNVLEKEKTIRDISQSTLNMLVGDRTIMDVIGEERNNIEIQGQELINNVLGSYKLGINVIAVKLRNIVPPRGAVQDAFEDVTKAQQDMNRFINEGKEAYNNEIPKARGQADQIVQEAMGYAKERVNKAQGDAARFDAVYAEYVKSKDITKTRLYIEMIEDVFKGDKAGDLIDRDLENFLPLKNMQQNPGGAR
ncbi:MAG: FtsH protease activity modulator HflK [Spirochaetia bacterium]|nr:FtsH protease activity modulator HflK [Spirochaetia bacterium]